MKKFISCCNRNGKNTSGEPTFRKYKTASSKISLREGSHTGNAQKDSITKMSDTPCPAPSIKWVLSVEFTNGY